MVSEKTSDTVRPVAKEKFVKSQNFTSYLIFFWKYYVDQAVFADNS